ncbi:MULTISPECIES: TetR/AcrR family transcriptional regulator [Streptomyces]|uniref:TetR/AcrR family transcriptional regulator n=1 Tax=Streptomyces TaxID=1883 RepID=UPI0029BC1389|nr:TetR/AcrR family transcriptional regulator C-terminal domain-containing protein [Streptomyces sp. ME02-6978.2a]MDX3362269.1 TetR/AcrR family transcriptional regulator C-terminal domain-containing protein [Streptomyces sp. ME02-6978.2a]
MVRAAERAGRPPRTSVWLEDRAPRGGGRGGGGQPSGLDRDRITAATVRLLDAEGLTKFSMRRLAAELNVTAMSVYWYVDTKDDLLELALDAAFGEIRPPDPEPHPGSDPEPHQGPVPKTGPEPRRSAGRDPDPDPADWREELRALARAYRALLVRHPWLSSLAGTFLNIGPHAVAFQLAVQRVVRRTGLRTAGQAGALSAVFQFVYGFGTIEGHFVRRCAAAGMSQDDYHRRAMSAVTREPGLREAVRDSADLRQARADGTVEEIRDRDFAFALELLIAGIETMVRRGE